MANQERAPAEVNQFNAGLNTDANPLNFPNNFSLDEVNMVLNRNGSRRRRLGMNYEANGSEITTTVTPPSNSTMAIQSFKWSGAGGNADKAIFVVQIGNEVKFFDLSNDVVSSEVLHTYKFPTTDLSIVVSFSVVDGILVAVNGDEEVYIFTYDNGTDTISLTTSRLFVRDLWGVEDLFNTGSETIDLNSSMNISYRPSTLTDSHLYNLRNQSFGIPRLTNSTSTVRDAIWEFREKDDDHVFPSNADSVNYAFYAIAALNTFKRFVADDLSLNPIGTTEAARGYFIIDALRRGTSRLEKMQDNDAKYPSHVYSVTSLPSDYTPGGPTVSAQYAGRIWFGGFSGEVVDGDGKSPRLSSYVLFSRLVSDVSDISKCYQQADPTSSEESDLVATDGGFVRIDGAIGLLALVPSGNNLFVICQNGVWVVTGGNDYGFSADNYVVSKVSDEGCVSPNSVVYANGTVFYWGSDGIYAIGKNQFGDTQVSNIVVDKIANLYSNIPTTDKIASQGFYNAFAKQVSWLYYNTLSTNEPTHELTFDIDTTAFSINKIGSITGNMPKLVSVSKGISYRQVLGQEIVVVSGDTVQVLGEDVSVTFGSLESVTSEALYVVITDIDPVVTYTFSKYRDTEFLDWKDFNGVGVDAAAYLLAPMSMGDNQHRKRIERIVTYLRRTETGFYEEGGQILPANPSSCIVQAQWGWSNSSAGNRWSTPRQMYRYTRHYLPANLSDPYDIGDELIITKDTLRGHGKHLRIKFSTEAGKDFYLYGWSLMAARGEKVGS